MWRDNFTHAGKCYPIRFAPSVCDAYGRMYAANTLKPCGPSGHQLYNMLCHIYCCRHISPLMVGRQRSDGDAIPAFFDANGLSYRKELVFTLLLLLLSIGAGYLLIQRKDLISLEK